MMHEAGTKARKPRGDGQPGTMFGSSLSGKCVCVYFVGEPEWRSGVRAHLWAEDWPVPTGNSLMAQVGC